jgi:sodium transport system permease protein
MRWKIIRLIWLRELRDQLRDRRTLFMIAVLPLLLYPVLGFAVLQFALGFSGQKSAIGFVRSPGKTSDFPERVPAGAGLSQVPIAAWTVLVSSPGSMGIDRVAAACALAGASHFMLDYPPLLRDGWFAAHDFPVSAADAALLGQARLQIVFLDDDSRKPLDDRRVSLILSADDDFFTRLGKGEQPNLRLQWRKDDDHARQALGRLHPILENWKRELKRVRLARQGLPESFDEPFVLQSPKTTASSENLFDLLVRIFPFMLVMWSLAGALYPAVDLCAGEKERGTMETLLISPAGREEIVLGKFLTIWVFSAATALLNLASMGLTTWQFGKQLPHGGLTPAALGWCVVLLVPLSAFFSAISLAVGAYARSSKEGQYYLMPLFLITMPLIFLTLAPGVELSPFYSLVPVTGVALLLQRLMTATSLDRIPWLYFIPVLAPIALYSWVALRWAIEQFKREEVLFREAERLDLRLWLRRLFREKEATPTTGQAVFCFALIMGLRWLSLFFGTALPALVHTGISLMAFVATPALLMAMLLNTEPVRGLRLRLPGWRDMGVAAVLSLLLLPPLAALAHVVFSRFPDLTKLLEDRQPLVQELRGLGILAREQPSLPAYLVVFGVLAAICEEVAFRGYILSGLLRRFRPRNAILLDSFLFALFHMNVFQFLPAFFLGVVLGLLTVRSQILIPAMIFHFVHNSMLVASMYLTWAAGRVDSRLSGMIESAWPALVALCLVFGLGILWWLYRKPYLMAAQTRGPDAN